MERGKGPTLDYCTPFFPFIVITLSSRAVCRFGCGLVFITAPGSRLPRPFVYPLPPAVVSIMSSKARAQKAFMYGLLGSCLLGFAAVVLVGVLVEDAPFSVYNRGGRGPTLQDKFPQPKLADMMKDFKPNECFEGFDLDWRSGANGQIYVNNKPFFMKGKSVNPPEREE